MFKGKILTGDFEEKTLTVMDMPDDFVLSSRKVFVFEEEEIKDLLIICDDIVGLCVCEKGPVHRARVCKMAEDAIKKVRI